MLGATQDNPLEFTLEFWALVCFAFVVIVLVPSIAAAVLMIKRRQALHSAAEGITESWVRSDQAPPKHRAVEQLQLNDHLSYCYRKTQEELETLGFKFLWDFTESESGPPLTFTRVMLGYDNTVVASCLYEKDESADASKPPYILTLQLGSWLMDGRFVISLNTLGNLPFVDVPGVDRVDYSADLPIDQFLEKHQERLAGLIDSAQTTPFPVHTIEDFQRGRQAYWDLCVKHHFYKRTCEKILAQNLAKEMANPETEVDLSELQAITNACYKELKRHY